MAGAGDLAVQCLGRTEDRPALHVGGGGGEFSGSQCVGSFLSTDLAVGFMGALGWEFWGRGGEA